MSKIHLSILGLFYCMLLGAQEMANIGKTINVVSPEVNGTTVTFRLEAPDARSVQVNGTMNEEYTIINQFGGEARACRPKDMVKNADGMLANANDLTRNLNELDLASTMNRVDNTLRNVEQMTAKLNSNEGTLGLLMRDPGLYNNLNATMIHADSLMIDLRQHPKRYVHFSVFGKKDK